MANTNLKDNILACAERLFKTRGYTETTFQMIADELNITKGAITYHFGFKWGIFDELFSSYLKSLHGFIREKLTTNYNIYNHYCIAYIYFFRQVMNNKDNWDFFYKDEIKDYLNRQKFNIFNKMFARITTDFHKDFTEEEIQMACHMSFGAVMKLLDEFEKGTEKLTIDRYCYYFTYLIGIHSGLDEATIKKNSNAAFEFLNIYTPPPFSLFN